MDIGNIINEYGENYSPYVDKLVNHLPMAQWSVFKITNDLDEVKRYSNRFINEFKLEETRKNISINSSLTVEDCLGNRVMYEECLLLIRKMVEDEGLENTIKTILNEYYLGLSSGLYHPLIRLAYAVNGYEMYESMKDEVIRSLAYYITSYRESIVFKRYKDNYYCKDMMKIYKNKEVQDLISEKKTLGTRIKALYSNPYYINNGFVANGSNSEKIYKLLNLFGKLFVKSNNIILLHCITGIHALILLENYFYNYSDVIDTAATSMISHIVAGNISFKENIKDDYDISWEYLLAKSIHAKDPHDIKLTYAVYELDKKYGVQSLKSVVSNRLKYVY